MPGDCERAASVGKAPRCTGPTNSDLETLLSGSAIRLSLAYLKDGIWRQICTVQL